MSDEHYEAIRGTYPDLDRWGQRVAAPYRPQPGSDLADDDADWSSLPLSQVAVSSIAAARDHLQAVRIHLEVRQVFPFAQASLLRTALLSAAQAVWLLAPADRDQRIERARTLTLHIYDQHLRFLRDLQARATTPHADTDAVERLVAERFDRLTRRRDADGQRARFNATDVIEAAALAAWGRPDLALEAKIEWRSGSGAAHGLLWSLFGQRGTRPGQPDAAGMATFQAGGAVDDLANPYFAAYRLLAHAFTLLDQRG